MRVLIVIDSLTLGGAERVLEDFVSAAPSAGLTVEVVSLAASSGDRMALRTVLEDVGVAPRFIGMRRLAEPRGVIRLARVVRASGSDVVHAHLSASITLAPALARVTRRPTVCTFHHVPGALSSRDFVKERVAVGMANRSRRVVFVSEASRRLFAARYGVRRNWTVIHNGVDLDRYSPASVPLPADLGVDGGGPIVTMVGALRPGKGHTTALAAWPEVTRAFPRARLVFVGSGELEGALRREAARRDVAGSLVMAGLRRDVPSIMQASDLVILPSDQEALPTVLIEAAACARPVVASRVGGVAEVVTDGETGILVPPRDPRRLAEATAALLGDERRRDELGRAARAAAKGRFDARNWATRLRGVYEQAVAN